MEFWGVQVKNGELLKVESGDGFIVHLSQACLGETKKDKGNESVCLFVSIGDQKLVLGTLSHEKIPQMFFDLVFEKDFELSHTLKNGSVYFSGYKVTQPENDSQEFDSESEEDLPVAADDGKLQAKQAKPDNSAKPDHKQKVKIVEPSKDMKLEHQNDDSNDEEDDSSHDDESSDDQAVMVNSEDDESEDEDGEDDNSLDEDGKMPTKSGLGKKRSAESAPRTPVPDKKAKFATPQKADLKKVDGHKATPYPSKQAAKTPANSNQKKEQAQKSFACKSCSRSFGSENALQSHTKAKHSAA